MKISLGIFLFISGITALVSGYKSKALHDVTPDEKIEIDKQIALSLNHEQKSVPSTMYKIKEKCPELVNKVHVHRNAFECNRAFCKELGAGVHGIGICSPLACACDKQLNAKAKMCEEGLIFDPPSGRCDYPGEVKLCELI